MTGARVVVDTVGLGLTVGPVLAATATTVGWSGAFAVAKCCDA